MSPFERRPKRALSVAILDLLPDFGEASLRARIGGEPVTTDPRFSWERLMAPVSRALSEADRERAIEELYEAAINSPRREIATVGAYLLIAEFLPELDDQRFLSLFDDSLETMRTRGLTSLYLNSYEARRWAAVHGDLRSSFDGLFEVGVPAAVELPHAAPLEVGASRMLALTEPLPRGNAFFAERQAEDAYIVYSERLFSLDDPRRDRYEEDDLGTFTSLEDLLRALGEMFGSPPHWCDDELDPYFPLRRA
jgi:hypothetical protein